ncbi:DUF4158 domain-containing protein [Fibrisoma montanum]|uniref:DUF4158 domain-containing protein n=1 Tax=Fibrisoma montanum TaxID=2305895 RepID=UPI001E440C74|nr:DUF4158 domain-containing protein [Fibrisoma montanum]
MPRRDFLSSEERIRFDTPPQLSSTERLIMTDWPLWAEEYLRQIHTPTNKVGFLLQLGYFRVVTRFFVPDRYPAVDVEWVAHSLQLSVDQIRLEDYTHNRSLYRHRAIILTNLGYQAFEETHRTALGEEARRLTHLQTRPALILDALVDFLRARRVEVPVYNTLFDVVTGALQAWDAHLQAIIEAHLTPVEKAVLDELLDNSAASPRAGGGHRYPLTELKRINQSMQPKQIAERLAQFRHLQALFTQLQPLIRRLELADDTIRYYAQYVLDNRSARMVGRVHERYLRLIAFIIHQYLSVGDALILTLLKAVAGVLNDCQEQLKEQYFQSRHGTAGLVGQVGRRSQVHIDALTEIDQTLNKINWTSDQKIEHIRQVLGKKRLASEQLAADQQRVAELQAINQPVHERTDYYAALEKASYRLQLRVSGIVQALAFDAQTSHPHLLKALLYFQERGGELSSPGLPVDFLDMAERQHVFTAGGKLRVSLYKVLLFWAVRDAIRCIRSAGSSPYGTSCFRLIV